MPSSSGPNTLGESNLVFAYDTGDVSNSYKGRPTVNVSAGLGLNNYNNVPGNVSTSITATGGTYKGAAIYQQTITPLDATGVSYLTNGNNPGIGVYHGGGGGTGGQYSGHTIFFKPVGPMHSSPIFTHYSNIGGWQSSTNYEDMGDGWFRAKVLWYSASTLSDQKFWAINPSGATANVPITIYWAGPFKENLNSTTISQFVEGTRSATQGLLPVIGNSTIDLTNVSFDSNAKMVFDGTNDYISIPTYTFGNGNWTLNMLINANDFANFNLMSNTSGGPVTNAFGAYSSKIFYYNYDGSWQSHSGNTTLSTGTWYMLTWVNYAGATANLGTMQMFVNGIADSSVFNSYTTNGGPCNAIGANWYPSSFNGKIDVVQIYNKSLTAQEVRQNYQQYKTRFNLS